MRWLVLALLACSCGSYEAFDCTPEGTYVLTLRLERGDACNEPGIRMTGVLITGLERMRYLPSGFLDGKDACSNAARPAEGVCRTRLDMTCALAHNGRVVHMDGAVTWDDWGEAAEGQATVMAEDGCRGLYGVTFER